MERVELFAKHQSVSLQYEKLDEMMDCYGQALQQLVYTYVKDYATAEDLTQEIFIKAFKKLHTFRQQSSIKTWLFRIAMNHCKDYLKSWHHRQIILDNDLVHNTIANEVQIEQRFMQQSEEQRLVNAVLQLPLTYREVVYLYYYEEWTIKEISQLTHKNENTIKTRLNRARKLIKDQLSQEGNE
ncbi:sigma-70 family RNA polymerase sigma factor [Halalkalibacter hemicellulosilyticus]|uniref:RNA polymerase sigma C factor n=1 Tax=Halalkalibacter hemicellulosilyticusJCM 9152 TaxID=1236971 RepID=W4QGI4_9BACI|nr:sigma-70 family RNA polymerase sigma factor [Halalkalibacter hemicellulosilyticus]GAE30419.1 RNA polymerase sigma C factor [Halalkalibacter hemicellulosilyticusJCM 9152]